ncbi:cytochrome P450 [Rhodocollybia butyracea]|uniref:Cytochrome P450 n=1 Tax=Rhodocollybia butyracea TaxID=206335 RepID=A0A9P5PTP6_9AGAR|nr:cytochrome P450 [Rhodocollybia butyracea]
MASTVQLVVSVLLLLFAYCISTRSSGKRHLPPGPKGWPIIGNIFDVPKGVSHITYMEMAKTYGSDLLYLNMAGTSMLILHSVEAVNDLLVEQAAISSDRPRFPMVGDLCGWNFSLSLIPYGEQWRASRALLAQQLSPQNMQTYQKPCIEENIYQFLNRLVETPEELQSHLYLLAGRSVLSTTYGIYPRDHHDPYLRTAEKATRGFSEIALRGTYQVDIFPALKYVPEWFPGARFKARAKVEKANVEAMICDTLEFTRRGMENGTVRSSIASRLLEEVQNDESWSEDKHVLLRNVLGSLYAAGVDTVAASIHTVILALVLNPDILKKGQAAVDVVVGRDRLPNLDDKGSIPYIDALVMEGLRWRPVVPLGMPHSTSQENIYRGYHIPANTIVIGNAWAILHNPATYGSDVDQFRPERFLNSDGTLNDKVPYPSAAFGYGRRVCAGKSIAQHKLWITVACLLACFDLEKGVKAEPSTEYLNEVLSFPRPYECTIKLRSKEIEALIKAMVEAG